MAKSANLKDFMLLIAAGKDNARQQHSYLADVPTMGPVRGAKRAFGRPYQSLARVGSMETPPMLRGCAALSAQLVRPFRMLAAIGQYDDQHTR